MADLVVPPLGESITEAVVSTWLKQVGATVAAAEPVAELETDKITVQLLSPVAGVLAEQKVPVGATVKVGDVVGTVEAGAQGKAAPPAQKASAVAASAPSATSASAAAAAPAASAASVSAASASSASPVPAASAAPPAARPAPQAQATPAASPAPPASVAVAPAQAASAAGDSLDKAALLRLTPSQRAQAREVGSIPHTSPVQATPVAAGPGVSGPSVEDRLAQVDPRDEVVAMSPLRKRG